MAQIGGHYDEGAQPNDFDQLEAGTYRAKIIESEIVDISESKSLGRCLKLTWQVETGQHDGKLIWQRLNMWWDGPEKEPGKVAKIANQDFAAIRQATGKIAPKNSEELHHIPCMITVGPQKNNPQYNEVKSVKSVEGGAVAQRSPAPAGNSPQRSAPAGNSGSAPWRKTG